MQNQEREAMIQKAREIIEQSHVSQSDKKLLEGRVPYIADVMLKMFVEVCEEDPFGIDGIVKSLKKKLDAQGNLGKLHEIIKQERIDVEELIMTGA